MIFLVIIVVFILIWLTPYMMNSFGNDVSHVTSGVASGFDIVAFSWGVIWVGGLLVAAIIIGGVAAAIKDQRGSK